MWSRGGVAGWWFAGCSAGALLLGCVTAEEPSEPAGSPARRSGVASPVEARLRALAEVVEVIEIDGHPSVVFTGVNVHVRNGLGASDCGRGGTAGCNGLGNLIVGYNEPDPRQERSGSHLLVIGPGHGYRGSSGIVAGADHTVDGAYASAVGGVGNLAAGDGAVAVGGAYNQALGDRAVAVGGYQHTVPGSDATVVGGAYGWAEGEAATVLGGLDNRASGQWAVASAGRHNRADGEAAATSGGASNRAAARNATVSGGSERAAVDPEDWVAGGLVEDF